MTPFIVPAAVAVGQGLLGAMAHPGAGPRRYGGHLCRTGPGPGWDHGRYDPAICPSRRGQDASAFYAASDPQIQVWRPEMYTPIVEAAKKRFLRPPPPRDSSTRSFGGKRAIITAGTGASTSALMGPLTLDRAFYSGAGRPRLTRQRTLSMAAIWALVAALAAMALVRRRWVGGIVVAVWRRNGWRGPAMPPMGGARGLVVWAWPRWASVTAPFFRFSVGRVLVGGHLGTLSDGWHVGPAARSRSGSERSRVSARFPEFSLRPIFW